MFGDTFRDKLLGWVVARVLEIFVVAEIDGIVCDIGGDEDVEGVLVSAGGNGCVGINGDGEGVGVVLGVFVVSFGEFDGLGFESAVVIYDLWGGFEDSVSRSWSS